MNVPIEVCVVLNILVIVATYVVTTKIYRKDNRAKKSIDIQPAPLTASPQPVSFDQTNKWRLEVAGAVKFDILVEWSDGHTNTFSGTAPQTYTMATVPGVVPINTMGIAPEWADDGISYQWHLNDHHWC